MLQKKMLLTLGWIKNRKIILLKMHSVEEKIRIKIMVLLAKTMGQQLMKMGKEALTKMSRAMRHKMRRLMGLMKTWVVLKTTTQMKPKLQKM